jgi:hypothetical protein
MRVGNVQEADMCGVCGRLALLQLLVCRLMLAILASCGACRGVELMGGSLSAATDVQIGCPASVPSHVAHMTREATKATLWVSAHQQSGLHERLDAVDAAAPRSLTMVTWSRWMCHYSHTVFNQAIYFSHTQTVVSTVSTVTVTLLSRLRHRPSARKCQQDAGTKSSTGIRVFRTRTTSERMFFLRQACRMGKVGVASLVLHDHQLL